MSTHDTRPVPESLPDVRDEDGRRICAVIRRHDGNGNPVYCGSRHRARGRCVDHYYEALREVRRSPDVPRHRDLGMNREQFAFWVPGELARQVRAAVAATRPRQSTVGWLEDALRAHLHREQRAPPPPGELVGALQDRCHQDSGPVKPGRSR